LVLQKLHGYRIIAVRNEMVSIWKTRGRYRKKMKCGYHKLLYHQRNKNETIIYVIKRLFGENISSQLIKMQRELIFRCIAYNVHTRINLLILRWFLHGLPLQNFKYTKKRYHKNIIIKK